MPVIVYCIKCGKEISVTPFKAKTKKFCSRDCKKSQISADGLKFCFRCRRHLPTSSFNANRSQSTGFDVYCKICKSDYKKQQIKLREKSKPLKIKTKICRHCKTEKLVKFFNRDFRYKDTYSHACKVCQSKYRNRSENKQSMRKHDLKRFYNLSFEEYREMQKNRDGVCDICRAKTKLVVDHCHTSKKVRGLLCRNCNFGLGNFKDNVENLISAITYLKKQ